jgi:hypothetical protein
VREIPTIIIDGDKKCERCNSLNATQSGLCLSCITKALKNGEYDHILKKRKNEEAK